MAPQAHAGGCPAGPAAAYLEGAIVAGTDGRMWRAVSVGNGFASGLSSSKRRKSTQRLAFWELVNTPPPVNSGHVSLETLSTAPVKETHRGCRLILDGNTPTGC